MKLCKNLAFSLIAVAMVLLCLLALPQTAHAASESDLTFTINETGDGYIVSNCDRSATGELVIPATYNGLPVTTIGNWAFEYCNALTSITVPKGVTRIHPWAFANCKNLTGVSLPDGLTTIGNSAFYGCTNLTNVNIPATVSSIEGYAFALCSSLNNITLPDRITTINERTFLNCSSLTNIEIPSSITSIGIHAFTGCSDLTDFLVEEGNPIYHSAGNCIIETNSKTLIAGCKTSQIPTDGSVTAISDYAFRDRTTLVSITIPSSVIHIGNYVFTGCTALTNFQVAEGNPVYHSAGNCIIETDSKTLIAGCKTSQIPTDGSVTRIGDHAFYECKTLTRISIPDCITGIGASAFYGCDSLMCYSAVGTKYIGNSENPYLVLISATSTNIISCRIERGTKIIMGNAFNLCSKLANIAIPNGVISIGDYTFRGCDSLSSITIPDSVSSIGKSAFLWCDNLTNVTYCGTQEQWDAIEIGDDNNSLFDATLKFHNYRNCVCTICKNENHNMQETVAAIASTCKKDGKTAVLTCANGCGKTEGGEEIPARHNYVNRICSACGNVNDTVGELDGKDGVTYQDAVYLLLNTMFGEENYPLGGVDADMDGNGTVNTDDAIYLLLNTMFGEANYPLKRD